MSPVIDAYRAMKVIVLTRETRYYLEVSDPKALEQLNAAIHRLEELPEVQNYCASNPTPACDLQEEPAINKLDEVLEHLRKLEPLVREKDRLSLTQ